MRTVEIFVKSVFDTVEELIEALKLGKAVRYVDESDWGSAYSIDTILRLKENGDVVGKRNYSEWRCEQEEFLMFNIKDAHKDKHCSTKEELQKHFSMTECR